MESNAAKRQVETVTVSVLQCNTKTQVRMGFEDRCLVRADSVENR